MNLENLHKFFVIFFSIMFNRIMNRAANFMQMIGQGRLGTEVFIWLMDAIQ